MFACGHCKRTFTGVNPRSVAFRHVDNASDHPPAVRRVVLISEEHPEGVEVTRRHRRPVGQASAVAASPAVGAPARSGPAERVMVFPVALEPAVPPVDPLFPTLDGWGEPSVDGLVDLPDDFLETTSAGGRVADEPSLTSQVALTWLLDLWPMDSSTNESGPDPIPLLVWGNPSMPAVPWTTLSGVFTTVSSLRRLVLLAENISTTMSEEEFRLAAAAENPGWPDPLVRSVFRASRPDGPVAAERAEESGPSS